MCVFNDKHITIQFASKTSRFQYPHPDTFVKFLHLKEDSLQGVNKQGLTEAAEGTGAILFFDMEVTSDGSRLLDIGAVKDSRAEMHTTNRGGVYVLRC